MSGDENRTFQSLLGSKFHCCCMLNSHGWDIMGPAACHSAGRSRHRCQIDTIRMSRDGGGSNGRPQTRGCYGRRGTNDDVWACVMFRLASARFQVWPPAK